MEADISVKHPVELLSKMGISYSYIKVFFYSAILAQVVISRFGEQSYAIIIIPY